MHMTDPQPRWSCTRIMGLIRQPYRHNPSNDLYLDQQSIDTTTPASKLRFQLTGALAEFERSMIRQRVRAGLSVIKVKLERDGKFVSKDGKVRRRLGRREPRPLDLARQELMKGTGIGKTARLTGLGTGTVHKLKREIVAS
jgi:DNA invertase Pin-like site-specific DNA recombinase